MQKNGKQPPCFAGTTRWSELGELVGKGVSARHIVCEPGSCLFLPQGYVFVEKVISGQIVCSVRASRFYKSDQNLANMRSAMDFFDTVEHIPRIQQLIDQIGAS